MTEKRRDIRYHPGRVEGDLSPTYKPESKKGFTTADLIAMASNGIKLGDNTVNSDWHKPPVLIGGPVAKEEE